MKNLNLDFYKGEDIYSDGEVEDYILDLVLKNEEIDLLHENFAVKYHLSHIRENILNWYPFSKKDTILEIGAGCGAITGALCEKAGKVVSVDLSKKRSTINAIRHKEVENLEIIVGNLNDIIFDKEFDYIILNGVLEYAGEFTETSKPYHLFLNNVLSFLKKNGKILIAIENRLGLKYFAGAAEDHTDIVFDGINNYSNYHGVRTFSKIELEQLLNEVGLVYQKNYYPFPDYKFPYEIFTKESIYKYEYGRYETNFTNKDMRLFDVKNIFTNLSNEQCIESFANSFLVEASKEYFDINEGPLYIKSNLDRKKNFQTLTIINNYQNVKSVSKEVRNPYAITHLKKMIKFYAEQNDKQIKYIETHMKSDTELEFPFLACNTMDEILSIEIEKNNLNGAIDIFSEFFDSIFLSAYEYEYSNNEFEKYFGNEKWEKKELCVSPANIDLIPTNVFINNGEFIVIDYEWIIDTEVPIKFIKWISINEFFSSNLELLYKGYKELFMKKIGIDSKDEGIFIKWIQHFAKVYVGNNIFRDYHRKFKNLNMEVELTSRQIESHLYYDKGNGFNETDKISYYYTLFDEGKFEIIFDISLLKNIKKMRFDPIEMEITEITIDNSSVRLIPINAECIIGNKVIFNNLDPQYEVLDFEKSKKNIVISGKIDIKNTKSVLEQSVNKILYEYENKCYSYNELKEQYNELKEQYNELYGQYNGLDGEYNRLLKQYNGLLENNSVLQNQFDCIINSRGYKFLEYLRKVKKYFIIKICK